MGLTFLPFSIPSGTDDRSTGTADRFSSSVTRPVSAPGTWGPGWLPDSGTAAGSVPTVGPAPSAGSPTAVGVGVVGQAVSPVKPAEGRLLAAAWRFSISTRASGLA